MKYYTGIGARDTDHSIMVYMTQVAEALSDEGYTLRSGGASGADTAFEEGATLKDIYLPWQGYNKSQSVLHNVGSTALSLAKDFHPNWDNLSFAVKKLMARNAYQLLGEDLNTPSEFVVCYTANGKVTGGTGMSLRIAKNFNIPIYNFGNTPILEMQELINSHLP
ncbi:MAG: hypothetical protein COA63_013955 [Methylophaga sp.]|nr:hypothetical protein [Methylophaga sp.]